MRALRNTDRKVKVQKKNSKDGANGRKSRKSGRVADIEEMLKRRREQIEKSKAANIKRRR